VLLRAFGPEAAAAPEAIDLAAAITLAETLGLAARIGARARSAPALRNALVESSDLGATLARGSQDAAVRQLRARELALEIAATARSSRVPCCLLKGAALDASGVLASGSRPIGDVDVLVPERCAATLVSALIANGFRAGAGGGYPHQLPALVHPVLGLVEVHRHLPGVAKPGARRFATFDDLEAAGMLVPCGELGGGVALPARPALLAHLLAHGLAQHGFQPAAYPALRLVGDLIDLGLAEAGADELLTEALSWIERSVPAGEARAAAVLCRQLARGEMPGDESDAAKLLRHFVAGRLDDRYAKRLKLVQLTHPVTPASGLRRYWSTAKGLLVLSRTQIEHVYGKPRSRWGYLGRRLQRPFDLMWRGARALYASARR